MPVELKVVPGGKVERGEALRELYQKYGPSVRSRCRYLLKNPAEAEDAMHEVFAKALEHLDGFRNQASPLTWLVQIATHHCLNTMRASKAKWREELVVLEKLKPVGEGSQVEGRELVRALLASFDKETAAAAVHYYVDEMTLEEVAQALGRSVPTVRKRLAEFAEAGRGRLEQLGALPPEDAEESHG